MPPASPGGGGSGAPPRPDVAETSPGARLPRPDGAALGDTLGTFGTLLLLGELGHGAFGRVYRAWEPTLARQVALKVVDLDDDSPSVAASVLEEGRLLARLRHPNIVTVHGAQQIGRHIGVWMELVAGRTLADIVAIDGPMSAEEAALVGTSLCHALGAVHAIGLVHRDVKAHNVMREAGGRIVLMDFGAGRDLASPALSHPGNVAGTPLYMAPERLMGQPATPASDLYSLGVLLYYLVTGRYPIETASLQDLVAAHAQRQFTPLADARPDIGPAFARVVERALASEPRQRYPSAGAMLRDLGGEATVRPRGLLDDSGAKVPPGPMAPLQRSPRRKDRRRNPEPSLIGTTPSRHPGRAAPTPWWGLALAGIALGPGVWSLGFLSTMVLNVSLGRLGRFGDESMGSLWVWGARSLISPLVQMAVMLLAVWVGWKLLRVVLVVSPRLSGSTSRKIAQLTESARQRGLLDADIVAQWLLGAQLLALGLIVVVFRQLLRAVASEAAFADRWVLEALAQGSLTHVNYRTSLFALLLGSLAGWSWLQRDRRATARPRVSTTVAGLAVMAVTVLLMQIPYRLLWQADFERVDLADLRCYETGRSGDEVMLFCPGAAPPRNPLVARGDARLRPHGFIENVFTTAPRAVAPLPPANEGSSP